jgi:membrane-associated PAP2 superfamily phosphatase
MGTKAGGMSFPSGHASMGFYLMAPAFLLFHRRRLAHSFVLVGLAGGLALGITRILQGAHFPSDVLWSAGFVYLSSLAMALAFGMFRREKTAIGHDSVRVVVVPGPSHVPDEVPAEGKVLEEETTRRNAA